jgi:hypothetical protein
MGKRSKRNDAAGKAGGASGRKEKPRDASPRIGACFDAVTDVWLNLMTPRAYDIPRIPTPPRIQRSGIRPVNEPRPPQADRELLDVIADLASCVWDIERKIRPQVGEVDPMKLKIAHRKAQRSLEKLKHAEFRIRDYKAGEPLGCGDSGLKVHLQQTEGAVGETISDTVSPTIYYKDAPIQMGEVWVAIPPKAIEPAATTDAPSPAAGTTPGTEGIPDEAQGSQCDPATATPEAAPTDSVPVIEESGPANDSARVPASHAKPADDSSLTR